MWNHRSHYWFDLHVQTENILAEEYLKNNFFDTEYLKADLKGRSVRGSMLTMAAQGVQFFLQIASTVALARLLIPHDYGLTGG